MHSAAKIQAGSHAQSQAPASDRPEAHHFQSALRSHSDDFPSSEDSRSHSDTARMSGQHSSHTMPSDQEYTLNNWSANNVGR